LILPALTLALISTVGIIYYLRSEIIDFETSDFVLTARSKGVPENKIYTRHILRNSLLPIAGGAGAIITGLFAGSFFIERVFSYPGMGELFLSSITGRDFPVANVLIMFYAILGVISVLITDIVITIIDPRIRIK
jgi:peptide/nickel transport system permease protein